MGIFGEVKGEDYPSGLFEKSSEGFAKQMLGLTPSEQIKIYGDSLDVTDLLKGWE